MDTKRAASIIELLPPNILAEIYTHCLTQKRRLHKKEVPLSVCHVCSSWRKAALNCSRLWNALHVDLDNISRVARAPIALNLEDMVEFWFNNAGAEPLLPLFFTLTASRPFHLQNILNGLVPFADRLRSLTLHGVSTGHLDTLTRLEKGMFSNLEMMSITVRLGGVDFMNRNEHANIMVFESGPVLRKARIDSDLIRMGLPWGQLTHLCILNGFKLSTVGWRTVFTQCPLLQRGSFCVFVPNVIGQVRVPCRPTSGAGVTYPDLVMLRLTIAGEFAPSVFDGLYFPALQAFRAASGHGTLFYPLYRPNNLFRQLSTAPLQSLVLSRVDIPLEDIVELLCTITCLKLERLAIDLPGIDNAALFQALLDRTTSVVMGRGSGNSRPLRCLTSFIVRLPTEEDGYGKWERNWVIFEPAMLKAFVRLVAYLSEEKDTNDITAKLKSVTVYLGLCGRATAENVEWLEEKMTDEFEDTHLSSPVRFIMSEEGGDWDVGWCQWEDEAFWHP